MRDQIVLMIYPIHNKIKIHLIHDICLHAGAETRQWQEFTHVWKSVTNGTPFVVIF